MEQMILTKQFNAWVHSVVDISNKAMQEKTQWEYYIHRIYDKTFEAFVSENEKKQHETSETIDEETLETTVKKSMDILASFNPIMDS